jgi:hypothetical protein
MTKNRILNVNDPHITESKVCQFCLRQTPLYQNLQRYFIFTYVISYHFMQLNRANNLRLPPPSKLYILIFASSFLLSIRFTS